MKSIEVHNEQLKKLLSDYDSELESNGYSEGTRKGHACTLRHLQVYMDNNELSDYDSSVGEAYYQDYLHTHENPGTCDVVKAIVRNRALSRRSIHPLGLVFVIIIIRFCLIILAQR